MMAYNLLYYLESISIKVKYFLILKKKKSFPPTLLDSWLELRNKRHIRKKIYTNVFNVSFM